MSRTVVVCDDDPLLAANMSEAIKNYDVDSGLQVYIASDLKSLRNDMPEASTDVLFLAARTDRCWDETKAALSDMMRANPAMQVVFTSVSEKNLVDVEQLSFAFLLPPAPSEQDVGQALDKAFDLHEKNLDRPFVIKSRKICRAIYPNKVSYIESDLRKLRIHLSGETVEVYGKLSRILPKLPKHFVRCHQSFVVNMGYVLEVTTDRVVLTTGEKVPVSQKRRKNTREAFVSYVGRVC